MRELNIDEAVAASQGSTAMHRVQHTGSRALSMDCEVAIGVGNEGGRGAIGIFPDPYHLRRRSLTSTGPEERTSRNVSIIFALHVTTHAVNTIHVCTSCSHKIDSGHHVCIYMFLNER